MYKFTSSNGSITKQHKIGKTMQAVLWCNVTEVSVEKMAYHHKFGGFGFKLKTVYNSYVVDILHNVGSPPN